MPISSVVQLDASKTKSVTATRFCVKPSRLVLTDPRRRRNGRTMTSIAAMYAIASPHVMAAVRTFDDLAIDTTNASRHQAVTSSTAAQVIVIAPTFVLSSRLSARIRASTGNAVTLIDTPMKRTNEANGTSGEERRG